MAGSLQSCRRVERIYHLQDIVQATNGGKNSHNKTQISRFYDISQDKTTSSSSKKKGQSSKEVLFMLI